MTTKAKRKKEHFNSDEFVVVAAMDNGNLGYKLYRDILANVVNVSDADCWEGTKTYKIVVKALTKETLQEVKKFIEIWTMGLKAMVEYVHEGEFDNIEIID